MTKLNNQATDKQGDLTEWEQACRNAARTFFTGLDRTADLPARQVAEEAHYAGGPSVDELERRIIADREAHRLQAGHNGE